MKSYYWRGTIIVCVLAVLGMLPVASAAGVERSSEDAAAIGEAWRLSRSAEPTSGLRQSLDLLARMHMAKKEWIPAVRTWKKLLGEFPDLDDRDRVLYQVAVCYEKQQKETAAIQALRELLTEAPRGPVAARAMIDLARLISARVTSRDDLDDIFFELLSEFSPFGPLPSVIARVNARCNQEFMDCDRAIQVLDDLVRLYPRSEYGARALLQSGIIYEYNLSDPVRARERFERAIETNKSGVWGARARNLLALHHLFFHEQGTPRARRKGLVAAGPDTTFSSVMALPSNERALCARTLLQAAAGDIEFRSEDEEWYAFTVCLLGHVEQFFLRNPERGVEFYQRVAEEVPASRWAGLGWYRQAVVEEFVLSDHQGALAAWSELEKRWDRIKPAFPRRETGGWLVSSAKLGRRRLAKLRSSSVQPEYLYEVASWLYSRGNYRESAARYVALASRYPESGLAPAALYESANIYLYELETTDEGYRLLEWVYTNYPDYEYAPEALYRTAAEAEKNLNYDRSLQLYRRLKRDYSQSSQSLRAVLRMAEINDEILDRPAMAIELYREALGMAVSAEHQLDAIRERLSVLYDRTPGMEDKAREMREATMLSTDNADHSGLADPLLPLLAEVESFYLRNIADITEPRAFDDIMREGFRFFTDTGRCDTLDAALSARRDTAAGKPLVPVIMLWQSRTAAAREQWDRAVVLLRRIVEEYPADEYRSGGAVQTALFELAELRWSRYEAAAEARSLFNALIQTWPRAAESSVAAEKLENLSGLDRLDRIEHALNELEQPPEDVEETAVLTGEAAAVRTLELLSEAADLCEGRLMMPTAAAGYLSEIAAVATSAGRRAGASFKAAELLAERGLIHRALEAYTRFIKEFPDDERRAAARLERGKLLALSGRPGDARDELTALMTEATSDVAAAAGERLWRIANRHGTVQEQVAALRQLLVLDGVAPERAVDFRLRCAALLERELLRPQKAVAVLEENGPDPRVLLMSARIKADVIGDLPGAAETIERVVVAGHAGNINRWALREREALQTRPKIAKHEEYIKKYPASPRLPEVLWSLARLYAEIKQDHYAAGRIYREIIALFPDSPQAREARKAMPHVPAWQEIRRLEQALIEGGIMVREASAAETSAAETSATETSATETSAAAELEENERFRARQLMKLGLLYEAVRAYDRACATYDRLNQELQGQYWLTDLALRRRITSLGQRDSAAALDEIKAMTGPEAPEQTAYASMAVQIVRETLEKKHYVRQAALFSGRYPDDIAGFDLLLNAADILEEDGQYEAALERLETLLDRYPGIPSAEEVSLRRCRLEERLERYRAAFKDYREHMETYGFTPDLALWAADLAVNRLSDHDTALIILKQALEEVGSGAAEQALKQKITRLESYAVVAGLEKMARRYGGSPSAPGFLMGAAKIKKKLELSGEALELFMRVADEYPTSPLVPEALWEAAELLETTFGDSSGAARLYRRLTEEYAGNHLAQQAGARLAALEAVEVVSAPAVQEQKVVEAADIKALKERMELDLEPSLSGQAATMEQALSWPDLNPSEKHWLHLQLADIYQQELGRFEQAAEHLFEALKLTIRESQKKKLLQRLAGLYESKLENYTGAARQLQVYIDEFPADPESAKLCFHLGEIYELRLGEYERARLYYERVINSFTDSGWVDDALFRLAANYEKHFRDYETALDLYQDLIDRYIDSPWADDAQYRRGVIYERYLREYEAAITEYEKVSLNYSSSSWERPAQEAISRLEGKF